MRTLLLASAALLALGGTSFAQTTFSGTAPGNPRSTTASNITAADTHSELAPALPSPGYDLTYEQLLMKAQQAVKSGRTGLAQQALEQAETRLLTRAVPQGQGNVPDNGPRVASLRAARMALSKGDRSAVMQNIQTAMNSGGGGQMGGQMGGMNNGGMNMNNGGMNPTMPPGASSSMQTPMPAAGMPPNGMGNNPAGQQGGGGNESSGPAQ